MPATADYMDGRVKYRRPQAVLFSDTPGTLTTSTIATGLTATSISYGTKTILVSSGDTSGVAVGQYITVTLGDGQVGTGAKITEIEEVSGYTLLTVNVAHAASGSITFNTGTISFTPGNDAIEFVDFIILTDHNRQPLDFAPERIEKRERMVNGRMRSYHIADKQKLSISWKDIPSRAYPIKPVFDSNGKPNVEPFTVDGGAAGNEILKWYEDHPGSFYVYLAYDKYPIFGDSVSAYGHMHQYNQVLEMYVSDFSHNVSKRGGLYDMWDVSISLEEA